MRKLLCSCQLLCLLAFTSCGLVFESDSYICSFHEIEKLGSKIAVDTVDNEEYARIDVYLKKGYLTVSVFDRKAKKQYHELCARHNDVSYHHRWLTRDANSQAVLQASFPLHDIQSVDLVTNVDFNLAHKAGSSLENITLFTGVSAAPFIRNRYKPFDYENRSSELSSHFRLIYLNRIKVPFSEEGGQYPIDKKLCNLEANDLSLLGTGRVCTDHMVEGHPLTYEPDVWYLGPMPHDEWIYNYFSLFVPLKDCSADRLELKVTMTDEVGNEFATECELELD